MSECLCLLAFRGGGAEGILEHRLAGCPLLAQAISAPTYEERLYGLGIDAMALWTSEAIAP